MALVVFFLKIYYNHIMSWKDNNKYTNNKVDLSRVEVRPIFRNEEARWNDLMKRYHYLGFRQLVGESLKYIAILEGEWVALLGWGTAAFKSCHRDKWIGWTPEIQWQRLRFIANNMRFLILPWARLKNLGSKVLALNIKRISQDWQNIHGHIIVLVETLVDHGRFSGTCYRAAGWIALGETKGFCRNGGRYYLHNHPKTIFVKPLRKDGRYLLSASFLPPELNNDKEVIVVDLNKLDLKGKEGLLERLSCITDPRKKRGIRHKQISILAVAICACLSGCRSFVAIGEWAANLSQELLKRIGCRWDDKNQKYVAPSEPTIRRVLQNSNADEVDQVIGDWLGEQREGEAIAIDGKTLKGSGKTNGNPVHLLAALVHKEGTVIAQREVDSKTNEIKVFEPLLDNVDVEGKVVTADALHTQVKHAEYLIERGADYIFIIKGNQPSMLEAIKELSSEDYTPAYQEMDKGHGRIETRTIRTSTALEGYIELPQCKQVFKIERTTTDLNGEKCRREIAYGATSLSPQKADSPKLLELSRGHWCIENRLHWVRDVTFDEDRSQVRTGSGPRVMASLRNLAISLFRLSNISNIAAGIRHFSWNASLALEMIAL